MNQLEEILGAVYRKELRTLEKFTPAELNLKDQDGRTPLMHAVLAEDADPAVVKFLSSHGADVNATDEGQKWTPLHFAARDQKAEIVRVLLEAGAQVDPVEVFGNTPLWRAVSEPSPSFDVLQELVERGADPYKKNNTEIAPIDIAHQKKRADIVEFFENAKKHI